MNVKQWFEHANGKLCERRVSGIETLEQKEELVSKLVSQLKEQGVTDIEVDDGAVSWGNQFWLTPKIPAVSTDTLRVFSKHFEFSGVRGDRKGYRFNIDRSGVIKFFDDGMVIEYILKTSEG